MLSSLCNALELGALHSCCKSSRSDIQKAQELAFFILVFTADFLLLLYRRARSAVRCRLREFCFANT